MGLIRSVNESLNTHRKVINTKIGDNANAKKAGWRRESGERTTVKLRSANKTCPLDVGMKSCRKKLIQRAVLHVKPPEDCWSGYQGFVAARSSQILTLQEKSSVLSMLDSLGGVAVINKGLNLLLPRYIK